MSAEQQKIHSAPHFEKAERHKELEDKLGEGFQKAMDTFFIENAADHTRAKHWDGLGEVQAELDRMYRRARVKALRHYLERELDMLRTFGALSDLASRQEGREITSDYRSKHGRTTSEIEAELRQLDEQHPEQPKVIDVASEPSNM